MHPYGLCAEPIVTVHSSAAWTWTQSNMDYVVCVWFESCHGMVHGAKLRAQLHPHITPQGLCCGWLFLHTHGNAGKHSLQFHGSHVLRLIHDRIAWGGSMRVPHHCLHRQGGGKRMTVA